MPSRRVENGRYFGVDSVLGYNCHHLAFTQDNIDWQVWIEDGPLPLIRKFVITHKNEPGEPEFTALIKSWDFSDRIADSDLSSSHRWAPPKSKCARLKPALRSLRRRAQRNLLPLPSKSETFHAIQL